MPDCLYLRKSRVDMEAEARGEKDVLARHEAELLRTARRLGRTVGAIYREVVSGDTIAARPVMQQLLREVEAGQWEAVLVMEVERLARGDTIDQGVVARAFQYSETKIITPIKTYDPTNEFDEEYFEFGLYMSRREYKTIKRRMQRGREASIREGKFVGNKNPYGYVRVKLQGVKGWTLAPDPPRSEVVQDIFRWYTEGYTGPDGANQLLGITAIANRLNALGIHTMQGTFWNASVVNAMLRNPVYAGWVRWNYRATVRTVKDGQVSLSRPRNKANQTLVRGLHPALVSQQTFDAAQKRLSVNPSRTGPKNAARKNPLAGLVFCSVCGSSMVRRPYSNGAEPSVMCPRPHCPTVSSQMHVLEDTLMNALAQWLDELEPEIPPDPSEDPEVQSLQALIDDTARQLKKLDAQIDRAYELVETGVYTSEVFSARSMELSRRRLEVQDQKRNAELELQSRKQALFFRRQLAPQVRHVIDAYRASSDPDEQNALLRTVLARVEYKKTTRARWGDGSDLSLTLFPLVPDSD